MNGLSVAAGVKKAIGVGFVVIQDVLRRHSLTLAAGAVLTTYLGKIFWYIDRISQPDSFEMQFLAFFAEDLLFWAAWIAALWGLEAAIKSRWSQWLTVSVAFVLALFAVLNVFWIRGTGGQITLSVIEVGLFRTAEVIPIIKAGLGVKGIILIAVGLLLPLGLPFLFKAKWRRDKRSAGKLYLPTVGFPVLLVLVGLLGYIERRNPDSPGWRLLADNAHLAVLGELFSRPTTHRPPPAVIDPAPVDLVLPPDASPLPNIVMVILEATAYRATSLDEKGPASTPFLKLMAAAGLEAQQMRAVVPHTSKSLFSALCGRYPAMQHRIIESADNYPMRCLPSLLKERGYTSAFIQSADGRFEDRPRLVANMGFDEFYALQTIHPMPQPLGYLAGDDLPAAGAALDWAVAQTKPYLLVFLTSATHHPYQLPLRMLKEMPRSTQLTEADRYLRLVSDADKSMGGLVRGLEEWGMTDNAIVVAFGDHGESFGDHGGWQHDNIYTEEGLRVPFVIQAPERVIPGTKIGGARSLLDVPPTVLQLAKIPFLADRFDGRSLLQPAADPVRRYFACWYTNTCVGYVEDDLKFVFLPSTKSWLVYRLDDDPLELRAEIEPLNWQKTIDSVHQWHSARQYEAGGLSWAPKKLYGEIWDCAEGQGQCKPRRPVK